MLVVETIGRIRREHFVRGKSIKEIVRDRAVDAAAGEAALFAFDEGVWGRKYPAIGQSWRRAWGEVALPSPPMSGGFSTPQMLSRRSTPSSGGQSEPEVISPPTRPQ